MYNNSSQASPDLASVSFNAKRFHPTKTGQLYNTGEGVQRRLQLVSSKSSRYNKNEKLKFSSIVLDPPLSRPPDEKRISGWMEKREESHRVSNNFVYNTTSSSEDRLILCSV